MNPDLRVSSGYPFLVKTLDVRNFRAFDQVRINLNPLTVFLGVNGSGKTSTLRAIALLLGDIVRRVGPVSLPGQKTNAGDFRNRREIITLSGKIRAEETNYDCARGFSCKDFSVRELRHQRKEIVTSNGAPAHSANEVRSSAELASLLWESIENDNVWLPLIVFYPVLRSSGDVNLRARGHSDRSRRSGYSDAFTAVRSFSSFFQWFREVEDAENEQRVVDANFRSPELNAVRRAVEALLPGYTELRVQRKPRLQMMLKKEGKFLSVEMLSDGELAILSLAGDLARRAALLNPNQNNPLDAPGCVLIDEIDAHLHPQWQRRLVQLLPKVFPRIQFILTTHSPIVAGSVNIEHLHILANGQFRPAVAYGWSMASILREVFELPERPSDIQELLVRLDKSIDEGNLVESEELVAQLSLKLPAEDPEIIRANVVIPFLAEHPN